MGSQARANGARKLTANIAEVRRMAQVLSGAGAREHPKDRFGSPMTKGSHVLFRPAVDVIYQIVDLKPILDPRAPVGTIQALLVAQIPVMFQAGQVHNEMVSLGDLMPQTVEATDGPAEQAPGVPSPAADDAPIGPRIIP